LTIFNEEKMEEYGIEEIKYTKKGEYFFNALPISDDPDEPYHKEVPVHYGVGIDNDQFICMNLYTKGEEKCYRCLTQKKGWKSWNRKDGSVKKQLVSMYPSDRCLYLVWDESARAKGEEPEEKIYIWNAPKKGAHAKIQNKVRNKKTQETLDISDVSDDEDSEGRTIYMKVGIKEVVDENTKVKSEFPQYDDFELHERDEPIPKKVLKQLRQLIDDASEEGMNAIEFLLRFPEQDELETAMSTEVAVDTENEDEPETKEDKRRNKKKITVEDELEDLDTKKEIKLWAKKKKIWGDVVDWSMDVDEMKEAIVEHFNDEDD